MSGPGHALLAALAQSLGRFGLGIVRPVTQAALDAAGVSIDLTGLFPGARAAVVVADGGPSFFAGFASGSSAVDLGWAGSNPLDAYTMRVVSAAVDEVLSRAEFALRFPFGEGPPLPIQQIGRAAGLATPGPLGLQIDPHFGPWWGYRALILIREEMALLPPLPRPCDGCPAPCIAACPAGAVNAASFEITPCVQQRLANPCCAEACAARSACIVGPDHRYPAAQLAFHMRASLAMIRTHLRDRDQVPGAGAG